MDYLDFLGIVTVIINYVIVTPLIVYLLREYKKYQNEKLMEFREQKVIYLMYIIMLFIFLIQTLYSLSTRVWHVINVPNWTFWLFWSATWFCYQIFAIKCYHLHYLHCYHLAVAEMSWSINLDPNHTNWYIEHKDTYGNSVYLLKLALIPYIIVVTLITIADPLIGENIYFDLIHLIILSFPICVGYYSFFKVKTFYDPYGIRKEIFLCTIAETIANLFYLIFIIIIRFIPIVIEYKEIKRFQFWFYTGVLTPVFLLPLLLLNTAYPIYLHKTQSQRETIYSTASTSMSSHSICNMTSIIKDYDGLKSFMSYLVNELSTENLLFIVEIVMVKHSFQKANDNIVKIPRYPILQSSSASSSNIIDDPNALPPQIELTRQLSSNNNQKYMVIDFNVGLKEKSILDNIDNIDNVDIDEIMIIDHHLPAIKRAHKSLTSLTNIFDNRYNNDLFYDAIYTYFFDKNGKIICKIEIPQEIPKSQISKSNVGLYDKMHAIYDKYIKNGSVHEINVSHQTRKSLTMFFEDSEKKREFQNYVAEHKLFNIMDKSCIEIIKLMRDSFRRYTRTTEYKAISNKDSVELNAKLNTKSKDLFNRKLPVIRHASSYHKMLRKYTK